MHIYIYINVFLYLNRQTNLCYKKYLKCVLPEVAARVLGILGEVSGKDMESMEPQTGGPVKC